MDDLSKHRVEHRQVQPSRGPSPQVSNPVSPCHDPRTDRRKFQVPDSAVETVLAACRRGVPETKIARSLGLNYRTWMRVRSEDERIASVMAECRKVEEDELVSLLLDKARDGDLTAIIFALKGRHHYRDQGAAAASVEQRVNVIISLPAAQASLDEYVRTVEH